MQINRAALLLCTRFVTWNTGFARISSGTEVEADVIASLLYRSPFGFIKNAANLPQPSCNIPYNISASDSLAHTLSHFHLPPSLYPLFLCL